MNARARFRGFTLIELLVVIAIIALLIGILLPALGEARRIARTAISGSNLRQHATAMNSYATDYKDRIAALNWQGSTAKPASYSQFPDLNGATNDNDAAANQAVDIIRRRTGRTNFPKITGWIPHIMYSHLVLSDYLAARLPEKALACPEDRTRLAWQRDPENNFDKNTWLPMQPDATDPFQRRWPYSSSYRPTISTFDVSAVGSRITTAGSHGFYFVPGNCNLGGALLASVSAPSQKCYYYEAWEFHNGKRTPFYALPITKYAIAMFDGSVGHSSNVNQVNKGWEPNNPAGTAAHAFTYTPQGWEPPTISGTPSDNGQGYTQFTRGGLTGIDVSGTEINTGQLK
jgi:prepilin-type N-terminal cleavage/methylation domain-containing protein